jgi:hypothetical protein
MHVAKTIILRVPSPPGAAYAPPDQGAHKMVPKKSLFPAQTDFFHSANLKETSQLAGRLMVCG